MKATASVLKILLGTIFVFSALSKFIAIDGFQTYIYSFGLLSLPICYYVARLVIAFELILAAALISHRHHRFTMLMTLLFLLVFVTFLAYAHLSGRSDNCHCFGDLLPFSPIQSILKNAVLIAIGLFVYKFTSDKWAPKWWLALIIYLAMIGAAFAYMFFIEHKIYILVFVILAVMLVVGLLASFNFWSRWYVSALLISAPVITIFIIAPPDNWLFKGYQEDFDKELFAQTIDPNAENGDTFEISLDSDGNAKPDTLSSLAGWGLEKGRHVVAFFSPSCGVCSLTAEKLSTIIIRNELDSTRVLYVFPQVNGTKVYEIFYKTSRSQHFNEARLNAKLFLRMTRGSFPKILLVENGEIRSTVGYNSLNESEVVDFLNE